MALEQIARPTPPERLPLLKQIQVEPERFEHQIGTNYDPLPETLCEVFSMSKSISTMSLSDPQKHLLELYVLVGRTKNDLNLCQNCTMRENFAEAMYEFLTYAKQQEKLAALTHGIRGLGLHIGLTQEEAQQTIKKLKKSIPLQKAVQPA